MRKICILEIFSIKRVQSFRFIREEEVASLISSITSQNSSSTSTNLSKELFSFTSNNMYRTILGGSFRGGESEKKRVEKILKERMDTLGIFSIADFYPSSWIGWIFDELVGVHARLDKSFRDLDDFYQQIISEHLDPKRVKPEEEDIIDVFLRLQNDQSNANAIQFSQNHIKALLMNLFLAGGDTTAETIVWAMAELAKNPRIMKKVQEEIRSHIGNKGKVEENDLDQLHYLHMVMKETLRLHPVAPLLLPRQTINHCKINGYDIKPKTRVHINVWAIGRDSESWRNPEEFYPERFMESSISYKGQHFELLPFGGGRRICPGIYLGIQMMELVVANLSYCFDWELPSGMKEEDMDMDEAPGLAVHKKYPLHLVPIKYQV